MNNQLLIEVKLQKNNIVLMALVLGFILSLSTRAIYNHMNKIIPIQNHELCLQYSKGNHMGLFKTRKIDKQFLDPSYWYKTCMQNLNTPLAK